MKNCVEKDRGRQTRNLFCGVLALVFAAGLSLVSCTDFYSSSWGEAFVRDPANVKVTSSNVYELLKDANGDKAASRAILQKLKGTDDPTLRAAAVRAANQAAGLTELVLSNLGTLTGSNAGNTDSLENLAKTILGEAKKNDIGGIADDVADTLPTRDTASGRPIFEGSFAKSASTSDLTLLLLTMMLAEASEASEDFDSYAGKWGGDKKINGEGETLLDGEEKVIAAIANEVISRPDSDLKKMLKGLVGE